MQDKTILKNIRRLTELMDREKAGTLGDGEAEELHNLQLKFDTITALPVTRALIKALQSGFRLASTRL